MGLLDWLPDECTLAKLNPYYVQLYAALKLSKGKYGITDRASCLKAAQKISNELHIGNLITDSITKCACKAVYPESKPAPPQWHAWAGLGGQIKGTVGAAIDPGGSTDLYVRGTDDLLWQKYYANGKWSDWMVVDNTFKLASSPTVVAWPSYRGIYARGGDGQVYHKYWDGKQWHAWAGLGGQIKGTVGAAISPEGHTDLYVRGTDDLLWQKYYANGKWSDWMVVDNTFKLTSSPTVVAWPSYRGIYARGGDGQVYHKYWDGKQWHAWAGLGGQIKDVDIVGAAITPEGHTDLYVRGTDDLLWQKYYANGKWSDWMVVDNTFKLASSPTVVAWNDYRGIYARGGDGQVHHKYWGLS